MRKIKVVQPSDRGFRLMDDFIEAGGAAFSVSRYGYENLKKTSDIDLQLLVSEDDDLAVRLLKPFLKHEANNLVLQLRLIFSSRNYDVIYYASDRHPYLISLARLLGLCRAPILMICHFTYNTTYVDGFFKKLFLRLERWLVFKGMDKICFLSPKIRELACEDYDVPAKHRSVCNWGADLKYFSEVAETSVPVPGQYYFSSGGAMRDYRTLIDAFRELPYILVLSCSKSVVDENRPLPANIIHYDFSAHGNDCFSELRSFNQGAKAVLIPIIEKNHVANGNSTFVEALACGKPVLISDTGNNFLDVEIENVGRKINMWDVSDWIDNIEYLEQNPQHCHEMGENSLKIAKSEANYALFSTVVAENLRVLA